MYANQNNYLQYSCFLSSCHTRNDFFFNSIPSDILFKYPYCNRIVIVKVITITDCFVMYSITITITCNHKNQRLQITFRLLKTCNRLHVITITDYNNNRSARQFAPGGKDTLAWAACPPPLETWQTQIRKAIESFTKF